jgi:GTP-binding protein YchF
LAFSSVVAWCDARSYAGDVDAAIVGLPQSGKTTTFNALTSGHGSASADSRGEAIGVVKLPDERLEKLAELARSKKVTPLEFRLHDLPALFQKGGPGAEATETLSRSDVLIHVVRMFDRADVPHPSGSVDPERDVREFESELLLTDLGIVERRLEKLDIAVRSARAGERDESEREQKLLLRLKEYLDGGDRLSDRVTDEQDLKLLAGFGFLTLKPVLLVLNTGEGELGRSGEIEEEFAAKFGAGKAGVAVLCAKLEAELAELSADEAREFRDEMGAPEGTVKRVLEKAGELLGQVTFFTIGDKEARAWTVKRGSSALQAAGRIHTDIERGFIRAEVIDWDKLVEAGGSHAEARKKGQLRTEGRDYVVQEGDVINVLFNV